MSAKFFTTEKIGNTREKTPEGYLLCRDVPISRIGEFDYSALETGIPGKGGIVKMSRTASELFKPETISSFEGKPVVFGHGVFPTAENWSCVAKGHAQNVRQVGETLTADLLITAADAIAKIEAGELEEISCGYDANSIADAPGFGHQAGIVGNHIALVEKARCSGCKIGDGSMSENNSPKTWKSRLRRIFKDSDAEAFNDALDEIPLDNEKAAEAKPEAVPAKDEDPNAARLDALEKALAALTEKVAQISAPKPDEAPAEEAKAADESEEVKIVEEPKAEQADEDPFAVETGPDDKAAPTELVISVYGDAETMSPGVKRPQGDAAIKAVTYGDLKRVKRAAIAGAGVKAFGDAAKLDGVALDAAFKASLEIVKAKRNPRAKGFGDAAPSRKTNAELNVSFRDFWSNK